MRESAASVPQAATVLNGRIIEELGQDIASGLLQPGDRLTLEGLQQEFGVSRTVVRDCMRILESMNLVYSKRRVGIVVQEPQRWNVFDPRVIAWRLRGPGRAEQFRALTELRVGVEPVAAAGAAHHASEADRIRLVELAAELRQLGEAGELDALWKLKDWDFEVEQRMMLDVAVIRDGRQTMMTPGNGEYYSAVYAVFGKIYQQQQAQDPNAGAGYQQAQNADGATDADYDIH